MVSYYAVHNQGGVPALLGGPLSARPAPGQVGRLYVSNEGAIYRDTVAAWSALSGDDAASILTKIKTVDGSGSGLDADTLDGVDSAGFAESVHNHDAAYVNESDHTKAVHDAMLIDAATLDGIDSTGFAGSAHNHDAAYVNETDHTKAVHDAMLIDAATLDGVDSTGFALANDARLRVVRDEGTPLTNRAALNFVGAGVTVIDDSANGETEVQITGASVGAASEAAPGTTEQATQAEVEAGTAGNLFATVARLKAELDRRKVVEYFFGAERATTNMVLNSSGTTIIFNQENTDKGNWYSPTTGLATIPVAGLYRVYGSVEWTGQTSTDNAQLGYYLNGTTFVIMARIKFSAGVSVTLDFELELPFIAGDTVGIRTTASVNAVNAAFSPATRFQMRYVGPL